MVSVALSLPSTLTVPCNALSLHAVPSLHSCTRRVSCNMIPDRQPNSTTMPFDQEGMKGYEVDGTIPDRYLGSAGELLSVS